MTAVLVLGQCFGFVKVFGHRWFFEPLPLDRYWLAFLMPLIAVVCVVYKTIKMEDLAQMPKRAGMLASQIMIFMVLAGAGIWLIVRFTSL